MRSPNTPFDAQFLVDDGTPNNSGLTTIHRCRRHRDDQAEPADPVARQIARASNERQLNRVQTLIGLA